MKHPCIVQEDVEQAERAKIRAEQNADALKTQSKARILLTSPSSCQEHWQDTTAV